jgi:hypothetical protein
MISERISEIIRYASIISVAFPLVLYFMRLKYASRSAHIVGALIIVSALSDIVAYFLFKDGRSTVQLFNSYYLIFFLLLAWFYYEVLLTAEGKRTVLTALVLYIVTFIIVTFFVQSYSEYQTLMWTFTGILSIIFSVAYFISIFSAMKPMDNFGLLWVNSGILFYFSFNLFLFIMSSYVLTRLDPELSLIIWSFHNVNNIIKNILIGLGISTFREDLQWGRS